MVKSRLRFVAVSPSDLYRLVDANIAQCREDRGITKRDDAFVHWQYGIGVRNDYWARLAVVLAKAEFSVFLGGKYGWCRQFYPSRLNVINR